MADVLSSMPVPSSFLYCIYIYKKQSLGKVLDLYISKSCISEKTTISHNCHTMTSSVLKFCSLFLFFFCQAYCSSFLFFFVLFSFFIPKVCLYLAYCSPKRVWHGLLLVYCCSYFFETIQLGERRNSKKIIHSRLIRKVTIHRHLLRSRKYLWCITFWCHHSR